MVKKFNSLEDLGKAQFDNLRPTHKEDQSILPPVFVLQNLEAHFSNKGRAGKTVTILKGFSGSPGEIKNLAKILKNKISVGGSIKNGEIIIQGNFRNKIIEILEDMGHKVKRVGG